MYEASVTKGTLAFEGAKGDLDWWQSTIIYQIYPRSFQDSNGDGVGDINGIISRLDHFKFLGVETIWLSPIYRSPMKDHGYDISDFKDIDPVFGTLEEFENLLSEVHKRGMKLMMDYIPNHSSDQHFWFKESLKGGADNPYSDYYVWNDGKVLKDGTRAPPNNWLSVFGGSAWEWSDSRQQYYFHQFVKEQPDLNWRNPKVREEMLRVFEFWLDKGVDGFRIDAIGTLFEVEDTSLDEPRSDNVTARPDQYEYLNHIYTSDLQETYAVVQEWRDFFNQYEKKTGRHHIYMVVEVYDPKLVHNIKYYHYGADGPFNFSFIDKVRREGKQFNSLSIYDSVSKWMKKMPEGKWPNWVTGNHDNLRVTGQKGPEYANAFNMLLLLLPGTPTTYQGEEIGMLNANISFEETQDPWGLYFGKDLYKQFSRDPARTPIQWSGEKNAGFSDGEKTWLPIHPNYTTCNVQNQKKAEKSTLLLYRELSTLRQRPAFQKGPMLYSVVNKDIFSFVRHIENEAAYLVAVNFGDLCSEDCSMEVNGRLFTKGKVIANTLDVGEELGVGKEVDITKVILMPGNGFVVELS